MTNRIQIVTLAATAIAVLTPASADAANGIEGARLTINEWTEDDDSLLANKQVSRVCPKSSFQKDFSEGGGSESIAGLAGVLITEFAGKGINSFIDWLGKRKERLNGTRTATATGEFYYSSADARPFSKRIKCIIFEAGKFTSNKNSDRIDVYAEFVPIYSSDQATFTLKPVYLERQQSIASAGKRKPKNTTAVFTFSTVSPKKTKNEGDEIAAVTLEKKADFKFDFGKLDAGIALDYEALKGISGGLGFAPPSVVGEKKIPNVGTFQLSAVWAETAKPSPLFENAVSTLDENKEAISDEAAKALRKILGLPEPEKSNTSSEDKE